MNSDPMNSAPMNSDPIKSDPVPGSTDSVDSDTAIVTASSNASSVSGCSSSYSVRKGALEDVDTIALHRVSMFRDMGSIGETEMDELHAASRSELESMMMRGDYLAWLVEFDGTVVAGGGIILRKLLPRPRHLSGGYDAQILNVFTDPSHRKNGVALLLMTEMMKWCRENEINRVSLHASDAGRHLYESLGFSPTNEMRYES